MIRIIRLGTFAIAYIDFESAPSLLHFTDAFTSIHRNVDHGTCLSVSKGACLHVRLEIVWICKIRSNLLHVSIGVEEAGLLVFVYVTGIALWGLHQYAVYCSIYGPLLNGWIIGRQFAAQLHLLTPVNTTLLVTIRLILVPNCSFFIVGRCGVLSLMLVYALSDGIRLICRINLRDVGQDHDVAVLVIVGALPVNQVVVDGVPLLASSVERLADWNLTRLVTLGRLNCKFLFVKRLLLRSEIVTLSLALNVEIQRVLLLAQVHLLLDHSWELIASLHAHRLVLWVHWLNSLGVNTHLLLLRVRRVVQRRWDVHRVLHVRTVLDWFLTAFVVRQWLRWSW